MGNNYPEIRELLQQKADLQARLNLLPYDGTPEIKEQSGKQYIYIRKRVASRLTSEYVDVYSDTLYQTLLRNAREARELKKQIRKIEKQLAQQGYTESELSDRVMLNIDFARANMKTSIYDQAVLEGVATTFPQTEDIIENGKVNGMTATDVQKILNLKHAWEFVMDKDVVSFKVADIESGRLTVGHRVHGKGPFEVACACEYDSVLAEKCGVTVSGADRRKVVIEGGNELAKTVNGRVMWKDSLLDEVQGLSEHPVPVMGDFDPSFLELPSIVLLTSMETHQKSFGVEGEDGKLLPHFLTVSNVSSLEPALVKKGWERVLRARLEDARFYWNTDMKASFEVWKEKLDHVIFLGPLGSMGDKCRRLEALCQWLAAQPGIAGGKVAAESAAVAGRCAKADLVSQMVGEFDTLQGIMGTIYGHKMGLDPVAADALAEQYLPAGPETPVPATDLGAILSMADKADTLVGCFGLGNIPTGAADPFALRRCALGIARILIEKGWRLPVEELFAKAQALYAEDIRWKLEKPEALAKLNEFFAGRVKNLFLTQGNDTLLVEAVMNAGSSDVWAASRRLAALAAEAAKPGFADNAQTFKRVANILRKQGAGATGAFKAELLAEEPEKALAAALTDMAAKFDALWAEDRFDELLALMDGVRPTVDAFFDGVMVMAEDADVRANRLDLLQALLNKMGRLADFSALQM